MGSQRHTGAGYGVHVPKNIQVDDDTDLWDIVEDEYSLLSVHPCGDYWNDPQGIIVSVESTTVESDVFGVVPVKVGSLHGHAQGVGQLNALIARFKLAAPGWVAWAYEG